MGKKYKIISNILGTDLLERVRVLLAELKIDPPFKGKELIEKEKIIKETLESGSTAANPRRIDREEVEFILKELFKT